ncbi:MAG: aminotransferase class IV, partial [Actinomycetota bacterium]|nr:aminotransferase class IV [Actinomycetota bacterium]
MSAAPVSLWRDGSLEPREDCDVLPATIEAADSWLVADGAVRALELHRSRFMTSIPRGRYPQLDPGVFWEASIAAIPREGLWFPRVELRTQLLTPQLLMRLREAPELRRSIVLRTHAGRDPRRAARFKGPDLEAMTRLRTEAQRHGADEAVLLSPQGFVAEGSTTSLAWWRGDALCVPADDIERIDGVTLRSVLALATAMGIDVLHESVTPAELEGLEVWALNAVHGIRIVTSWVDGPATAEEPGRFAAWQARLEALRRPLP